MPRIYTTEEKERALELYRSVGPREASRQLKINDSTICLWAKRVGAKPPTEHIDARAKAVEARIALKRAKLKERLLDEAIYCAEAIHSEHVDFKGKDCTRVVYPVAPAAAVHHYAVSLAIFLDKFRLENGEVTGREEVVTVDAVDAAIRDLEAELARRGAVERGAPD